MSITSIPSTLALAIVIILNFLFNANVSADDSFVRISQVSVPKLPPASRTSAVYLTLENLTEQNLILTEVTTPVAKHAMIHRTIEENGLVRMQHQQQVKIPAGGKLVFQSGSYHIMLMGLNESLIHRPFTMTLNFAQHTPITVSVNP